MRHLNEIIQLILRPGLRRSLVEVFFLFFLVILLTATFFYITGQEMMLKKLNSGITLDELQIPVELLDPMFASAVNQVLKENGKQLTDEERKALDLYVSRIRPDIVKNIDKKELNRTIEQFLNERLAADNKALYVAPVDETTLKDLMSTHISPGRIFGVFANKPEVLLIPLLLVVLALLMAPRILKPIKDLTRAAENLATGDWNTRIEVKEQDEIATLAGAFEIMRENIREKVQRLEMTTQELAKELAEKSMTLDRARELQRRLVPSYYERSNLKVATGFMPMEELGGDFVDLQDIGGDRLAFIFGDVEGHGISASFNMMAILTMFRFRIHGETPPDQLAIELNHMIFRDHENPDKAFTATALVGIIDLNAGKIEIVNAGHPNPVLWSEKLGQCVEITQGYPILGISDENEYKSTTIDVGENDKLLLFTDGLMWITDKDGNYFGTERLTEILCQDHDLEADQIITRISDRIRRFMTNNQIHIDDILFALFSFEPEIWSYLQIPPLTKESVMDEIIHQFEKEKIPNHIISDFRLAMDELITNAMIHGNLGDLYKKIFIKYSIGRGEVRMKIRDEGEGFKHDAKIFLLDSASLFEVGRRGIYLVKSIMDEMFYNDKGNEVTIIKKIKSF